MRVTVEEINGRKCTVIRKPFDAEWVREQLSMGIPVVAEIKGNYRDIEVCLYSLAGTHYHDGIITSFKHWKYEDVPVDNFSSVVVILPALPRHPKPEHAGLLYRYMGEGITPCATVSAFKDDFDQELAVYKNLKFIKDWYAYDEEFPYPIEITHAEVNGERVEIAIEENVTCK